MANVDAPDGLTPYRHTLGGTIRVNSMGTYKIATAYNTAIFRGDPVVRTGTTNEINVGAASSTAFIGVFEGVEYTDASGNRVFSHYYPASTTMTDVTAHVYDDPYISFSVQHNNDGGTPAITDYGNTADIAYTAGSTVSGRSKVELDTGDVGTGINLKILGPIDDPDNAVGNWQRVEVLLNEHELRSALTAV